MIIYLFFLPVSASVADNFLDYLVRLETIFWVKILKFFEAVPDPGIFLIRDPGWKKF